MRMIPLTAVACLLAACGQPTAPAGNTAAAEPIAPAASPTGSGVPTAPWYLGRWTGVEGMVLDVAAGADAGTYRLTMQYDLDHRQTAEARLEGEALVFTRDGKTLALRPTDGEATGLKYLAGKQHCLTVAPGEGYCRD